MMKLLGVIALVAVVIAATVVITKHSDDILAAFTSWTDSSAQVPGLIPFQAVLTDSTGALVNDGDYTVTFAFYSAAAGGTSLWSETQVFTIADGLFNTHLGNTNPIAPSTRCHRRVMARSYGRFRHVYDPSAVDGEYRIRSRCLEFLT